MWPQWSRDYEVEEYPVPADHLYEKYASITKHIRCSTCLGFGSRPTHYIWWIKLSNPGVLGRTYTIKGMRTKAKRETLDQEAY